MKPVRNPMQRLESQRTLAVLIACVMTVVAVVAIAAPPIAAQQREVRERSAELSIPFARVSSPAIGLSAADATTTTRNRNEH